MRLYSQAIVAFVARLEERMRTILEWEVGLPVKRKTFHYQGYDYPIKIVCFEDERATREWGHFHCAFYRIGINRALMYQADESIIDNVLRHELAHYISFIEYGSSIPEHGPLYRDICRRYHWGPQVFRAGLGKIDIQASLKKSDKERNLLAKIQKLLALGSSSCGHEAELATLKANELLIKHNLRHCHLRPDEEEFCVVVVATAKRLNTTMQVLYQVLENFLVHPVMSHGLGEVNLEALGTRLNVELADYVAKFLQGEFERLWQLARRNDSHLKGRVAKNSFLRGMGRGLCEKLQQSRQAAASGRELVALNSSLNAATALVYPHLGKGKVGGGALHCRYSAAKGLAAGANISIRPGLRRDSAEVLRLNP